MKNNAKNSIEAARQARESGRQSLVEMYTRQIEGHTEEPEQDFSLLIAGFREAAARRQTRRQSLVADLTRQLLQEMRPALQSR